MAKNSYTTENGLRTQRHETTTRDDGSTTKRTFDIETRRTLLPDTENWVRTERHDSDGNVHIKTRK